MEAESKFATELLSRWAHATVFSAVFSAAIARGLTPSDAGEAAMTIADGYLLRLYKDEPAPTPTPTTAPTVPPDAPAV
jgi:hypothetical protein